MCQCSVAQMSTIYSNHAISNSIADILKTDCRCKNGLPYAAFSNSGLLRYLLMNVYFPTNNNLTSVLRNLSINCCSNKVGDTPVHSAVKTPSQDTMVKNLELFSEYKRDFTIADKNRHTSSMQEKN